MIRFIDMRGQDTGCRFAFFIPKVEVLMKSGRVQTKNTHDFLMAASSLARYVALESSYPGRITNRRISRMGDKLARVSKSVLGMTGSSLDYNP